MFRLLRPFEYHEPRSIPEALALLDRHGSKARILAGGTDLLISMKKREVLPVHVISINRLSELNCIDYSSDTGLRLAPLSTHAAIAASPVVREHYPMLATACNEVGTPQVRNMGTIGGNLCKAGPSQDTPPVLVALEARLKLAGPCIGLGSVSPVAMRARQAESILPGEIPDPALIAETARTAAMEAEPRSRAGYRRHMIEVLVKDAITELHRNILDHKEKF